ncbi:MAG: hypothetical protein JSW54_03680 [Fidelibacterota bacterium]|nr:MAG: hypothetical protein JSW54_03680 [Candidatus Neomarinimicrobiota bacterium]
MRDGGIYVLREWQIDVTSGVITGTGNLLDINRQFQSEGMFRVPIDSVVIFETNQLQPSPVIIPLTIITVASALLSIHCLQPKACFGSCPTFYLTESENQSPVAEGFSASVAPVLEDRDIDALGQAEAGCREIEIRMTNEALETHAVRYVHLLAAPCDNGSRIFATGNGRFWRADEIIEPSICEGPEGDCREALLALDGTERFSTTDPADLAVREIVDLQFDNVPDGRLGLVIGSRQTLLTTYLFYQGLAYLGSSVGWGFANMERNGRPMDHPLGQIGKALGGIEVMLQNDNGEWEVVGEDQETGPIATDVRLVPLPRVDQGPTAVRLRLTRGHWRLDYIALAVLEDEVEPYRLAPIEVYNGDNVDEEARALLLDPSGLLTTLPGDEYTLVYQLPGNFKDNELFLESRGYYLEWMREGWLAEEDPLKMIKMFQKPYQTLRDLAPEFKKIESQMEETFWNSRYERP